jgi:hypothetical protein
MSHGIGLDVEVSVSLALDSNPFFLATGIYPDNNVLSDTIGACGKPDEEKATIKLSDRLSLADQFPCSGRMAGHQRLSRTADNGNKKH